MPTREETPTLSLGEAPLLAFIRPPTLSTSLLITADTSSEFSTIFLRASNPGGRGELEIEAETDMDGVSEGVIEILGVMLMEGETDGVNIRKDSLGEGSAVELCDSDGDDVINREFVGDGILLAETELLELAIVEDDGEGVIVGAMLVPSGVSDGAAV